MGIQVNAQCLNCDAPRKSTIIGYSNTISQIVGNDFQTVIGNNSSTTRNNAMAIGSFAIANGSHSYVIGSNSSISINGVHAYVLGSYSSASASSAYAIGYYAKALTTRSMVLGYFVEGQADGAFVIGKGLGLTQPLVNHISNSLVIGFNSTRPTLFVGDTPAGNQSGKVAIGNMLTPTAKLHIFADANEDASLKLDATGVGKFSIINFTTNHYIKAAAKDNFTFNTQIGQNFVFLNGNMGVGTTDPAEKLEVTGNIKQTSGYSLITSTVKAPDANGLKLYNTEGRGIFISNSGNVGLGTISPTERLEVTGNIKQTAGYKLFTSVVIAPDANGLKLFNVKESGIFVSNLGYVGLGTITPSEQLEVIGNIKQTAGFNLITSTVKAPDANGLKLYNTTGSGIFVSNTGNVGLGTITPKSKFEVQGTVSIGYNVITPETSRNLIVRDNIGVGTFAPTEKLEVVGKIKTTQLQITDGYNAGFMLLADQFGNAIWTDPQTITNIGPWTNQSNNVFTDATKKIGIGITQPQESLHVNGNFRLNGNIKGARENWQPLNIFAGTDENDAYISLHSNYAGSGSIKLFSRGTSGRIEFHNQNTQVMSIRGDNNVYFGSPDYTSNLFVNGEISANLVRVNTNTWWDKVLQPGYKLMPLNELDEFIQINNHLPEIPDEAQVLEKGINLGDMNGLLLKKIEELTLYLLEQEKKINTLQTEVEQLKNNNP
jgi:hypothetical protein